MIRDQKHPLAHLDREIIKKAFVEGKTDYNLAEVARLIIRYKNFPGAKDIQHDLGSILQQWEITEEQLYIETRRLHQTKGIYGHKKKATDNLEDWS